MANVCSIAPRYTHSGQGLEIRSMATARQSWQNRYRAARSAYKFWGDFERHHPSGDTPQFLHESLDACPLFKPTRLHGDVLGWFTANGAKSLHKFRMLHLAKPAPLPGSSLRGVA